MIKNLLYLLQLEDYNVRSFNEWIQKNPNRIVEEKKKKLLWTKKIKMLYIISMIVSPALGNEKAIVFAVRFLRPFEWIIKKKLLALVWLKLRLFHKHTLVIGICGSWGKTTAKDKLNSILKTKYKVYTTKEDDNTLFGIALSAYRMPRDTEIFIVEIDAWGRGEIRNVCNLVCPTIGIITAIGPMHLDRFGNIQDIYAANLELYESLPKNGFALLPQEISDSLKVRKEVKTVFFEDIEEVLYDIGKSFGIDAKEIKKINKETSVLNHLTVTKNNGIITIDDPYNSNPRGFQMAIEKLASYEKSRKILVTPGMIELGTKQFSENKKAMEVAAKICSHIIIVGEINKIALLQGIQSAKGKRAKAIEAKTLDDAKTVLLKIAVKGSVVLFENDLPDHYF